MRANARTTVRPFVEFLALALVWLSHDATGEDATAKPTYANPPERVVWLEGEECSEHNWVPGATTNCWWYEYAGITGSGLLDLASWRLPDEREYRARYEFELPEDGEYVLYYRGRHPGYQASPVYWQTDEEPERRQPPEGKHPNTNLLAHEMNWKVVLIRLGTFRADAGKHSVTIKVRDFVEDRGEKYISQGIDSLLIGKSELVELPEQQIVQDFADGVEAPPGGPGAKALRFEAQADPKAPEHKGQHLAPKWNDWSVYDRLHLWVHVEGDGEHYDGKLRCYYQGPKFVDLPVRVLGREFGKWQELTYDLPAQFKDASREAVHGLWLYTYGKWYTRPAKLTIHVGRVELSAPNAKATKGVPAPVRGAAPPEHVRRASQKPMDDWVWNVASHGQRYSAKAIRAGKLSAGVSPLNGGILRLSLGIPKDWVPLLERDWPPAIARIEFLSGRIWQPTTKPRMPDDSSGPLFEQTDDDVALRVLYESVPEKDELRVTATIGNRSREPICSVALAPLAGIGLAGGGDDTYLVGSRRYAASTLGKRTRLISPQLLTHDWVCVHDTRRALHVRWEDPNVLDTEAVFGRGEGGGYLVLRKFPRIQPGEEWQAPALVIGADSTGNWHEAADRFSGWWHSWAKTPIVPEWLKSVGGIAVTYGVLSEGAVGKNRETLAKMRVLDGIFWGHTSDWLPLGTEAWYPHGYRLTEEQLRQFRDVTDALHAEGGRMSIYSNPLMFSRVVRDYDEYGRDLATVGRDGNIWLTEHTHRHHPMALPYPNAKWARRYLDAIEPAVVEGKPDALYMDQLGAVPTHLDFAPDKHEHQHYGEWAAGQVEFVREVEQRLRPKRPDLVTMIECPSPAVQQHVTLGLLMYGAHDIYRYTFPHYLNAVGHYTGDIDAQQGLAFVTEALLTGQSVLLFTNAVEKMDAGTQRRIRELILFKQKIDPLLHGARYRATRGLTLPEGVQASCFVGDEGHVLVPFVNGVGAAAEIRIDFEALGVHGHQSAWLVAPADSGGKAVPVVNAGGAVAVSVPSDSFGVVEFPPG